LKFTGLGIITHISKGTINKKYDIIKYLKKLSDDEDGSKVKKKSGADFAKNPVTIKNMINKNTLCTFLNCIINASGIA
jgi:hypothetical protein